MKKKKINKKLPKYEFGTFKKLPAGYQQANSLGDSTFSTLPGAYNIDTYTKTARKTMLPDTISNIIGRVQYPLQAAFNTTKIAAGTSLSGASAINAAGGILSVINNGGIPTVGGALNEAGLPTQIGATTGKTSHVLNAAGKSASILGLGYSVGDALFNTIPGASLHRTASDMDDTISRSTYTTAGGNTYTTYGNPDLQGELEYGKQLATKSRLGLASDAAGAVSSALALSGVGAPLSLISYPITFAATLGLGSLFGFGDNSDEIEHEARKLADVNAGRNRMNQSVAESKDIEMGRAANGKMPGFHNGKANARVSNGEVIGNFKDGYFRVPGGKNNEDNVKTHLGKLDFVISNKHGLSDYAWLTGDIPGALAALSYLQKTGQMNKYKNGRLPKFDGGTKRRFADVAFSMIPHGISAAQNLTLLLRALNADIYAPDFYVENPEGAKAVNTLASLRFDADPYYREAQRGLNQANWDTRRLVSLGIGGRAIMQNANYAQYLNGLRDITKTYNEANNTYKEKYANALASLGATNQGRRMQANAQRHQLLQQANAAKENWMAQYRKNIDQNLLNAASEYMKWGQYNDSLDTQNRMLDLYERQAATDELKANTYINSLGGNKTQANTSTGIPLSYMVNMAKTPLSKYGFAPGILEAINRTPTIKYKNGKMPKYEDGLVDTRSDTTYQGYNPNPIPWGAGLDAAGQGPLALLDGIEAVSLVSNNPYLLTGIAPSPGKVTYTPEQMTKLWLKHGQEYARKNKLNTFMGPNGKMYAHMPDGKVRSFEAIGKEIRGEEPITYTAKKFKPVDHTIKKVPKVISTSKKTYNYGAITANDFK